MFFKKGKRLNALIQSYLFYLSLTTTIIDIIDFLIIIVVKFIKNIEVGGDIDTPEGNIVAVGKTPITREYLPIPAPFTSFCRVCAYTW